MPLLDLPTLLDCQSLAELDAAYRQRSFSGDEKALLKQARADFFEGVKQKAEAVVEAPPAFIPESATLDAVRYDVYGVIHGILGGDDRSYLEFVSKPIREAASVLFENGLHYFYPSQAHRVIPDFVVLGLAGSLSMGFYVGWSFPFHLWDMVKESFKSRRKRDADEGFLYDTRYYSLDMETRRGLETHPPLPAAIEADWELKRWKRSPFFARLKDPFSLVPRSLFMAGFAVGDAKAHQRDHVSMVLGDLHTAEVIHFLKNPPREHPLFKKGARWGAQSGIGAKLHFAGAKLLHLTLAGLGGSCILLPAIFLILWLGAHAMALLSGG
jgi:hypothetical protein